MYDSKSNSALNNAILNSPHPTMQQQDSNSDVNRFFNVVDLVLPTGFSNMSWGTDQIFDFNNGSEYPFPQSQSHASSFDIAPGQAPALFMTGFTLQNMLPFNNSRVLPTGSFAGRTAAPSALLNTTSSGYNTRQVTGPSAQKIPSDMSSENTESNADPAPKKPRKQRKKRSKEMSQAEAEEKRQKFLDRNKVAAHKCRQLLRVILLPMTTIQHTPLL
ncbi:uncharacterized protein LY89DRAFT_674946 [Mollisia scopiformis]|uniref:BZIP domain-containing protein n=1 Tax=Mollisia scopiformis TaxID=149040 RepID=A0A194WT41_MOLSC|nr:uncharacterized protein LY89DRAFT_674946 [Mollisia scopiformis]KUJ10834.1 hypothetical protein LY89DRAFT_674946 [Mollisia scopiformis]